MANASTLTQIKWNFPPLGGGVAQGFNISGKEFFAAGVLEHVAREIIQNSLDAKDQKYVERPVIVRMDKIQLESGAVNSKELEGHVKKSLEATEVQGNQKGSRFYKDALKTLRKPKIDVLRVVDENTTGLNGDKWDVLVYQEGTTSKDGSAAGGSFGIGKNAPYAASALGLVCYSTRYANRHRVEKFIGRCQLVAHYNPYREDEKLQHWGFGTSSEFDGSCYPPVLGADIHDRFRLGKNGTGIFIIGFKNGRDWETSTRRSIASNFFAAIHDRNLEVHVGKTRITNETLNGEDFGGKTQRQYYDLYKDSSESIAISGKFGKFHLKIATGDDEMENRVAYVNRRGMLVTVEKGFTKNPFYVRIDAGKYAAVVRAADDNTDDRVRKMEPPTHESIEYKRISDHAERTGVKKDLEEIRAKIRDEIRKKLNIDELGKKTELDELRHIMPFIYEPKRDSPGGKKLSKASEVIDVKYRPVKDKIESVGGEIYSDSGEPGGGSGPGGGNGGTVEPKGKIIDSNMGDLRIVRHGENLRVAFDSKTGANKFVILPAGEEDKGEEPIRVKYAGGVSNVGFVDIRDGVIIVNTDKGSRVVMDLAIGKSRQYTGYSIVEYQTRRRRK